MTQNADNFLFYAGINTFGGYKYTRDLKNINIAIMGVPFDSGKSNRSGTRMGPNSIRSMSHLVLGFNYMWRDILNLDKIKSNIIDYGDIGQSYGSKSVDTMIESTFTHAKKIVESGVKLLTLGGDHTIPYGPVQAAYEKYGKLALIHFDSHQDTMTE